MGNYKKQIEFVNELGKVLSSKNGIPNVETIEYKVFKAKDAGYVDEYAVVTFKGGAISARNCSGNSQMAILSEIATLVRGGYYEEVNAYKDHLNKDDFEEVTI